MKYRQGETQGTRMKYIQGKHKNEIQTRKDSEQD